MKIGLIGLPQVGKKTLFELLTGEKLSGMHGGQADVKIAPAIIRDTRFDKLVEMYSPKKVVPATIDVVLLPKVDKDVLASGDSLESLKKCDALCHIVRAFADDSVFHVEGSVDPIRDIDNIYAELILSDLILIEKRLERLSKELMNKPTPQQKREEALLIEMKELLEKNIALITMKLSSEDIKLMSTYQFLTKKPLLVALNVNEDALSNNDLLNKIQEKYREYGIKVMQISAKIEVELSSLDEAEREAFLSDLNIKESALNQLTSLYYDSLGLISFFTVGDPEVHAWITKKNSTAPEAAGSIHSDLQRGFIRAEIMKCADLLELGDEIKLKEAGKMHLKGKDYIVEDGDIMHVRFNV